MFLDFMMQKHKRRTVCGRHDNISKPFGSFSLKTPRVSCGYSPAAASTAACVFPL